jgi:hypothetical protein
MLSCLHDLNLQHVMGVPRCVSNNYHMIATANKSNCFSKETRYGFLDLEKAGGLTRQKCYHIVARHCHWRTSDISPPTSSRAITECVARYCRKVEVRS